MPTTMTPEMKKSVLEALKGGSKPVDIAKTFGVPAGSVRRLKFEHSKSPNERTNVHSNVQSNDVTSDRAFEAPQRSTAQPSPETRTVRTVERPDPNAGAPAGSGAGGANAARTAANADPNAASRTPPLDPQMVLQQEQQFCVDTVNSIKSLLGGGSCAVLDINYNRVGAENFKLSPIGVETVRANAQFLAPHLKDLFGDQKMLWMVLGMEAAVLGGTIYRCYREDHPLENQKPKPQQEQFVEQPPMPNGESPVVEKKALEKPMQSMWNPKNQSNRDIK